jgi:hypothetical protein
VTADRLRAGPDALGEAKYAVMSSPARAAERERHHEFVSDLLETVDEAEVGDQG